MATITNNAVGFLAEPLSTEATQLVLVPGTSGLFPSLGTGQSFFATIVATNGEFEIVRVTRTQGDIFTIQRGAENTVPRAFTVYSKVELRVTAGNIDLTRASLASILYKNTRPGDSPQLFELNPSTYAPVGSVNGLVIRVTGTSRITSLVRVVVEPGRIYNLKFAYTRFRKSGDPANDGITGGIIWYNGFKNFIAEQILHEDNTLLTTSGRRSFTYSVAQPGMEDVDFYAPTGARYGVAWIRTFGADHETDIEVVGLVPALDAPAIRPSADDIIIPPGFQWPPGTIPPGAGVTDPYDVARTFYVTADGSDANSGTSLSVPKATIGSALEAAEAEGVPCAVLVHPGEYTVQPDTLIPANCTLYGYDLRTTKVMLPPGLEENNMFLMDNGIRVRGFTFIGLRHEAPPPEWDELYPYPPQKGYAFAFKPDAFITRSPYISDCSVLHDLTVREMSLPIDKDAGNPEIPRTGGNIIADGSILNLNSPLRSVVVDSFTAINPNGVGYLIQRNAFVQLVSVFTNWSRVGVWSHLGGHVTIANSNNTFGDISLLATSFRYYVAVGDDYEHSAPLVQNVALADDILQRADDIINDMYARLLDEFESVQNFTPEQEEFTRRDARTLLKNLSDDFRSGQDRGVRFFIKGLFDWDAYPVFSATLLPEFIRSFEILEDRILARSPFAPPEAPMLATLFGLIKTAISDAVTNRNAGINGAPESDFIFPFGSLVEATGQQLSYGGAGVNYNALPSSQRGSGVAAPVESIQEFDGGRVYATFGTENGDTYLGRDLRVDFERSVIEGQAFSRGVQNIALPLIIGLGGR